MKSQDHNVKGYDVITNVSHILWFLSIKLAEVCTLLKSAFWLCPVMNVDVTDRVTLVRTPVTLLLRSWFRAISKYT